MSWKSDHNCIKLFKETKVDMVPTLNASWVVLDVPNGTAVSIWNLTRGGFDELTTSGDVGWNVTKFGGEIGGGGNSSGGGEGFWWEEVDGGDYPVKFGPDFEFLKTLPVYINLLLVVAAVVLAIGIACRCVAAKVRLTLNKRRGPEIAFHLGETGEVIERVVAVGIDGRRRDGIDGDAARDPRRYAV